MRLTNEAHTDEKKVSFSEYYEAHKDEMNVSFSEYNEAHKYEMKVYFAEYSGTSLIRTSLNRNLANPNGKALVNFFFLFFFVLLLLLLRF